MSTTDYPFGPPTSKAPPEKTGSSGTKPEKKEKSLNVSSAPFQDDDTMTHTYAKNYYQMDSGIEGRFASNATFTRNGAQSWRLGAGIQKQDHAAATNPQADRYPNSMRTQRGDVIQIM